MTIANIPTLTRKDLSSFSPVAQQQIAAALGYNPSPIKQHTAKRTSKSLRWEDMIVCDHGCYRAVNK